MATDREPIRYGQFGSIATITETTASEGDLSPEAKQIYDKVKNDHFRRYNPIIGIVRMDVRGGFFAGVNNPTEGTYQTGIWTPDQKNGQVGTDYSIDSTGRVFQKSREREVRRDDTSFSYLESEFATFGIPHLLKPEFTGTLDFLLHGVQAEVTEEDGQAVLRFFRLKKWLEDLLKNAPPKPSIDFLARNEPILGNSKLLRYPLRIYPIWENKKFPKL